MRTVCLAPMNDSSRSQVEVRQVHPTAPDAGQLLESYFAELRTRFGSFDPPTIEELCADAARGVVLVVDDEGQPVASGSLRLLDADVAEVKRMFVVPQARGRGIGRLLLRALEDHARSRGCRRVVLDTAATLREAANMYLREGYVEIERYNDNPYAARWFEKQV